MFFLRVKCRLSSALVNEAEFRVGVCFIGTSFVRKLTTTLFLSAKHHLEEGVHVRVVLSFSPLFFKKMHECLFYYINKRGGKQVN